MWRLIIDEGNAYWNMAIDEAMLVLKDRGLIPNTLRLYVFRPSAVTIGYFQRVLESVDVEFVESRGIDYTRRITGGGSVYHDADGEVTYSVTALIDDISRNIMDSYRVICQGVVNAIRELGLEATFVPVNDVIINGKKVSGSAQSRRRNALLQHGTLMYNTNLITLSNALKAPKEKLLSHKAVSIFDRVTTVSRELGRVVSREEVINALIRGFSKALNIDLELGGYTREELELANELVKKYRGREWIYQR